MFIGSDQEWKRGARRAGRWLWRRLVALRGRIRVDEETLHLLVAGVIGVAGGVVNLALSTLLRLLQWIVWGSPDDLVSAAQSATTLTRVVTPVVGGVLAGCALYALRARGAQWRSENLLEIVASGDGRLSLKRALSSAAASMLSLVSGASLGREGAITHLSSAVASAWGQRRQWPPFRLRLMVACGAAAGMAAAYNAPIAGAIFAGSIILGNFAMGTFAPLVVASVSATLTSRSVLGVGPIFDVPEFEIKGLWMAPAFVLLGALCGVFGAVFLQGLNRGREWVRNRRWPPLATLPVGGALVGIISIGFPEVWGNGNQPAGATLRPHEWAMGASLLLLLAKGLATVITVSSGAVGGVFTPTLMMGALLGAAFGDLLHWFGLHTELSSAAFALIGMGGMLAATTHSALLALILIFEISLNHSAMPSIMLCVAVATLVSRRFHRDSVYTLPLKRLNLLSQREVSRLGVATEQTVGDVMDAPRVQVAHNAPFSKVSRLFMTHTEAAIPVVDEDQKLVGEIRLQDLKEWLHPGTSMEFVIAEELMRPTPKAVTPDRSLLSTLPLLIESETANIPVVNNVFDRKLVGVVARRRVLSLFSEAIQSRTPNDGA